MAETKERDDRVVLWSSAVLNGRVNDGSGAYDIGEFLAVCQARQGDFFIFLIFDCALSQSEQLFGWQDHNAVSSATTASPGEPPHRRN